jgi:regulator of PEP synthase PpsR (kinase-PPPase family)
MQRIYIVSDGTGQTAMDVMRAALAQFESPQVKFTVFSKIDTKAKLRSFLKDAQVNGGLIAFTLAKKAFREEIVGFCVKHRIPFFNILNLPINILSDYLDLKPVENPNLYRRISERYFRMIEALDFTMAHDDGMSTDKLDTADVIIIGLSRTSKTPTSLFLAQQGYRVVNIPIVPEVPLPRALYAVDQKKIVCLTMDPEVLQKVRMARIRKYQTVSNYTNVRRIFEESEFVHALCAKNRSWKVIDTTNRSVEETCREIINAVFGQEIEF